ncbi:hypothetical protein D9M68_706930 [compost metagenome]
MDPRIAAQPKRSRHFHPGLVGHLQHGELLRAVEAGRQRGERIAAQHPAPGASPWAVLDQQFEQPVFLDGAAAQALAGFNDDPRCRGMLTNEIDQTLIVGHGRERIAGRTSRRGTAHGSMVPAFGFKLAGQPEQRLGQLCQNPPQTP